VSNPKPHSPPSKMYLLMEEGLKSYQEERKAITSSQLDAMLATGKKLLEKAQIVETLLQGGTAIFPHTFLLQSGSQIAAVAQAALLAAEKSGKNQILVIGVLHALSEKIWAGRQLEIAGENVHTHPCRGIFVPGHPITEWEFSLDNFLFLLDHAANKGGKETPKVVVRYPNHVAGSPDTLEGIEELRELAATSIVVGTGDLLHHGACYGTPKEKVMPVGDASFKHALATIQHGLKLLCEESLLAYRDHCYEVVSDMFEVGQILRTLLGPLESEVHDCRLVDLVDFFDGHAGPNWVAASLVALKKI